MSSTSQQDPARYGRRSSKRSISIPISYASSPRPSGIGKKKRAGGSPLGALQSCAGRSVDRARGERVVARLAVGLQRLYRERVDRRDGREAAQKHVVNRAAFGGGAGFLERHGGLLAVRQEDH